MLLLSDCLLIGRNPKQFQNIVNLIWACSIRSYMYFVLLNPNPRSEYSNTSGLRHNLKNRNPFKYSSKDIESLFGSAIYILRCISLKRIL